MKRRQKAALKVLKKLDASFARPAMRKNRGNDNFIDQIIAAELGAFEQNTGFTVEQLLKSLSNENGHCPKEYRLIHIRPIH